MLGVVAVHLFTQAISFGGLEESSQIQGQTRKASVTLKEAVQVSENQNRSVVVVPVDDVDHDSPFRAHMRAIQWQILSNTSQDSSPWELQRRRLELDHLVQFLVDYEVKEPIVPTRTDCHAPPLIEPEAIDCSAYPEAFAPGMKRTTPAKIGHAIQLGYDADTLEVHLQEVYDLVDYFFIAEWTLPHNTHLSRKPLIWDKLKTQERFLPFQKKIVHLVLDDLDAARVKHQDDGLTGWGALFRNENYQERTRWKKIMEWNELERVFGPDDLIGFGDADEVPSRHNLQLLKYCTILGNQGYQALDVGIWFPFGRIDQAFQTDHSVPGYPYSYGDPTFWTFQSAVNYRDGAGPTRMRGRSPAHLLGGMHMTHYGYLPYQLLKLLTCSDATSSFEDIQGILQNVQAFVDAEAWLKMEQNYAEPPPVFMPRIQKITELSARDRAVVVLPWFYVCNPDRYPSWVGSHDTRLDH
jgi:hypothetical protein